MKKLNLILCLSIIAFTLGFGSQAMGEVKKPYELVIMTPPFGSSFYNTGAALEQVFKKSGSWIHLKHMETPGAAYIYKYMHKYRRRMLEGRTPWVITSAGFGILDYLGEGRPPFDKTPLPNLKTLVSHIGLVGFYVTMDPAIKTLKDLAGKRVGTANRSQPFLGELLDRPLFEKSLGIYDQVKWAPLGDVGAKDAFLNGKIDAFPTTFGAVIAIGKDGSFSAPFIAPAPPTMEVLSSGKKLYAIPMGKALIEASYDPEVDMIVYPAKLKSMAQPEVLKEDIYVRSGFIGLLGDAEIPDEVVAEIVRVRYEFHKEFGKYHAAMKLWPKTPYPVGSPERYIHPGVIKAMKAMDLKIPAGTK